VRNHKKTKLAHGANHENRNYWLSGKPRACARQFCMRAGVRASPETDKKGHVASSAVLFATKHLFVCKQTNKKQILIEHITMFV
jgi:hypothetical protein